MTGRDDPAEVAGLADRIVAAVTGCAAVAGLTEAPGGPVATYLPGRTISGVAVRDGEVEVCVVARYGLPLLEVAEQVRQAVAPLVRTGWWMSSSATSPWPDQNREGGP